MTDKDREAHKVFEKWLADNQADRIAARRIVVRTIELDPLLRAYLYDLSDTVYQAARAESAKEIEGLRKENADLKSVLDWNDYENCIANKVEIEGFRKMRMTAERGLLHALKLLEPFSDDGLSLGLGRDALKPIEEALQALAATQNTAQEE